MSKYEFKGTKGDWYVSNTEKKHYQFYVMSEIHDIIEEMICSNRFWNEALREEHMANAHLISAAPDLLQALMELNSVIDNMWNDDERVKNAEKHSKAITSKQRNSLKAIHKALNIKTK